MLGIVSSKKYKEVLEVNKELGNTIEMLTFENDRLNSELKKKIAFELNEEVLSYRHNGALLEKEVENQKKLVQKLKALCTKNGVDYKHLIRKGK